MRSCLKFVITINVGVVLLICGIVVGILWPMIYDSILEKQLKLSPASINYKLWKETPIPMYLRLHMFNWTNYEDFQSGGKQKPNFVEMGPYVFRQVDYKVNQEWNANGTITFHRKKVWHFDQSLSNGSLSDKITNLNPVATTVAYMFRFKRPAARDLIGRMMYSLGQRLTVTKTVKEMLFEGYNDTMLLIARALKVSKIPYTKFGWFYDRNGTATSDGTFNLLTGASSLYDTGILKEWNFNDRTEFYKGQCGEIKGSLGDLWPPLPDNKTIPIFVSDICTSLELRYENSTTQEGLTGSTYISDDTMLDNGTKVPSRNCYCQGIECVPSGALNISLCKYDAPIFVSLPHFYLADPSYRENIEGMNPEKEKHEMSLSLEPETGVPLRVEARLQLNMLVQPDDEMAIFRNINRTFIPMLWFKQDAKLTSQYSGQVKFLKILESLGVVTFFGIAAIGLLISFIGIFLVIRQRWRADDNRVLLSENENYDGTNING